MLRVVICVGSACYVRGSEHLADALVKFISEYDVEASVALTGAFCMEHCSMGVSIRVGDRLFTQVDPADALAFFLKEILPHAGKPAVAPSSAEASRAPDR